MGILPCTKFFIFLIQNFVYGFWIRNIKMFVENNTMQFFWHGNLWNPESVDFIYFPCSEGGMSETADWTQDCLAPAKMCVSGLLLCWVCDTIVYTYVLCTMPQSVISLYMMWCRSQTAITINCTTGKKYEDLEWNSCSKIYFSFSQAYYKEVLLLCNFAKPICLHLRCSCLFYCCSSN